MQIQGTRRKMFPKILTALLESNTVPVCASMVKLLSADQSSVWCILFPFCGLRRVLSEYQKFPFPIFQLSSCSSLRRRLHRCSVSSYHFWRFCAKWWIWLRVRLSSLSIVGIMVSVHTVRGRPKRRAVSGALRGSRSSVGSNMHSRSG